MPSFPTPLLAAGFSSGCHGESWWEHCAQEQLCWTRGRDSPRRRAPRPAVLVLIPPGGVAEAQGEQDEEELGPEPWWLIAACQDSSVLLP